MSKSSGPFWDAIEGRAPVPRAAATLGSEFISADIENGTIGDGDLAFLEATLADSAGAVIATATATARVIGVDQARSAA